MAGRNSPSRRLPGNPLGGVLRQTARMARRPQRQPSVTSETPEPDGVTPPVAAPVSPGVVAATVLVTDATGVATLFFDDQPAPPVVTATATAATPVVVTVRQVGTASATLVAWQLDGTVAAGVAVSVTACAAVTPEPTG